MHLIAKCSALLLWIIQTLRNTLYGDVLTLPPALITRCNSDPLMVTLYLIHLFHSKTSPTQPPDELILTKNLF